MALIFAKVVQSFFMIKDHTGFIFGVAGGFPVFFDELFCFKQRIGIPFNLRRLPGKFDRKPFKFFTKQSGRERFKIFFVTLIQCPEPTIFFIREQCRGKRRKNIKIKTFQALSFVSFFQKIINRIDREKKAVLRGELIICAPPSSPADSVS